MITVGQVYRDLRGYADGKDGWVRVVGWFGPHSVAYESVRVHFSYTLNGVRTRVVPDRTRQIYTNTVDNFSRLYREPTPEDAK